MTGGYTVVMVKGHKTAGYILGREMVDCIPVRTAGYMIVRVRTMVTISMMGFVSLTVRGFVG